ncbi:MAG: gamma carbonic anhydrase family protein [Melioribacteraceae bacterium]|nr:gamma carbonic anhydrase family protein [Melioribacteraceae bacterium]MCF8352917.1 gamma carbonic anhydrase family protein [Melioribacteraceae bacterium]MCF8395258.1 gamma carbonic anhydrase family protein [Melioribacteraceae bacterium]MCF8417434.1 gamma carbonic anhydrase family protein [Melioribacteraceae bacterium]
MDNETKLFPYKNTFPNIHPSVFLASGSKIVGDVEIGEDSSVWYNSVIRGDVHYVRIGRMTNIQDLCMLHVTNGKFPLNIGDKVTIGHSVKLHGCTVDDLCFIGIGAIVLDGAVIKKNSMVAAGAVVKPGFIVPTGKLAAGVPAKIMRDLTQDEISDFENSAERYRNYSKITVNSLTNFNDTAE